LKINKVGTEKYEMDDATVVNNLNKMKRMLKKSSIET
jgi:hypothetical protein